MKVHQSNAQICRNGRFSWHLQVKHRGNCAEQSSLAPIFGLYHRFSSSVHPPYHVQVPFKIGDGVFVADELDFFAEAAEPRKELLADLHICCHREMVIVLLKIKCVLTLAEALDPVFADVLRLATGCEQVIVAVVKQTQVLSAQQSSPVSKAGELFVISRIRRRSNRHSRWRGRWFGRTRR